MGSFLLKTYYLSTTRMLLLNKNMGVDTTFNPSSEMVNINILGNLTKSVNRLKMKYHFLPLVCPTPKGTYFIDVNPKGGGRGSPKVDINYGDK